MSEIQLTPPEPRQMTVTAADDAHEEVFALMSMALDGLLEAQETERLEVLMKEDPGVRATWQQWQKMDNLLTTVVRAEPEVGFVARFEQHLAVRERRERSRRRALFGAAALVGWSLAAAVLVFVGWILVSTQTQWMNGFVRELVLYTSSVSIWMRALQSSLSATVSAPQSLAIAICYMAGAAVMLSTWLWFLRRTTREETAS